MTIVISEPDQTTKQPIWWFCTNLECKPKIKPGLFEFESDYPKCPKCGAEGEPMVQKRTLVHYLQRNVKGPIKGLQHRFVLCCDETRTVLATTTNGEAATGVLEFVNCPGCLKAVGRELRQPEGDET
jgi:hypothetical protein